MMLTIIVFLATIGSILSAKGKYSFDEENLARSLLDEFKSGAVKVPKSELLDKIDNVGAVTSLPVWAYFDTYAGTTCGGTAAASGGLIANTCLNAGGGNSAFLQCKSADGTAVGRLDVYIYNGPLCVISMINNSWWRPTNNCQGLFSDNDRFGKDLSYFLQCVATPVIPVYYPAVMLKQFLGSSTCQGDTEAFFAFANDKCLAVDDICSKFSERSPSLKAICSTVPTGLVKSCEFKEYKGYPAFYPYSAVDCPSSAYLSFNPILRSQCMISNNLNSGSHALNAWLQTTFTAQQIIYGISQTNYESSVAYEQALQAAIADSMSGVSAMNVTITDVYTYVSAPNPTTTTLSDKSLRDTAEKVAAFSGIEVEYTVSVDYNQLDYLTLQDCYNQLSSLLSTAVSTGAFVTSLKTEAYKYGAVYFEGGSISSNGLVTSLTTTPGTAPTSPPQSSADSSSSSSASEDSGLVAGLVTFFVLAAVAVAAGWYYYTYHYSKRSQGGELGASLNDDKDSSNFSGGVRPINAYVPPK